MKILLFALLATVVWCDDDDTTFYDRLFYNFDGSDSCLDRAEFDKFWMNTFDVNHDGGITEQEFINEWRRLHTDPHAPLYFMELDRVKDEIINAQDLEHMFQLFDIDGNGCVRRDEFDTEWRGLFYFPVGD